MPTRSFHSDSAAATRAIGRELAAALKPGDVLLLKGELGSGKTCLAQGLAEGLGAATEASSPTFTLIHEYPGGRLPLYHVDLYRLESAAAVAGLGLDEYFDGEGVTVLEWPERLPKAPEGAWQVVLSHAGGDERQIELSQP